jgi:tetratricopeptide (TPR) repeat protein
MPPEEGLLLLLRRAKVPHIGSSAIASEDAQVVLARLISDEVGGLPLALDQAGAYIDETGCGLRTYLDLYQQDSVELLKRRGRTATEHDSVARTFALSFDKVENVNPAAGELLRLCAFLHAHAIPEEIITQGAPELGPVLGPVASRAVALNDAIAETLKYSLLQRDSESRALSIHRVVQAIIKSLLTETQRTEWPVQVVKAISIVFPEPDFPNWALCERLIPNAQYCASLIELSDMKSQAAAQLLHRAAMYLIHRGRFNEAEPIYKRALAIQECRLGLDHPDVARIVNDLGHLYFQRNAYTIAEPLLQRALAIREKSPGSGQADLAMTLNNLAGVWLGQRRYAEAEPLFQRALAIREKSPGPEHAELATVLTNLAVLYSNQGKYAEAEALHQRALAIREKELGPEHPDLAHSLHNLAMLYLHQRRDVEAEPLFQRGLAIWEKAAAPEHPNVATLLASLADLYRKQGRYAKAEPLFHRALAIREKALSLF